MQFPTTLFHKERAPEGQVFMNEAALPTEDGWVDTPAAFVAGYKKPEPVIPADSVPADAPAGFIPQPYPSTRYRLGDEASARTVATAEEDAALEAAEPGVWKHSHDPKAKVNRAPEGDAPDAGKPDPNALADLGAGGDDAAVVLTDAQKAEVQSAKATDIFLKVSTIGSPKMLDAIAAAENERPDGPRVTVLKAIKARLAELTVSAE